MDLLLQESLLVLLSPLIAGLLIMVCRRAFIHGIAIGFMSIACFNAFLLVYQLGWVPEYVQGLNINLYRWAIIDNMPFHMGLLIDRLSVFMMAIVSFISLMVYIYSVVYIKGDPGARRFFSYLCFFTFSMLALVMANNALQLFFAWEAVGLMSYLLISFWFTREAATQAGLKAFLVNRIGDVGFIVGIAGLLFYFNSLDYHQIFTQPVPLNTVSLLCLLLFMGAMAKSAQIPLHSWLPDSMEGPTPVSALIHAATMVTAGVFLLARFSPLFEYSPWVLNIILMIGASTTLLMGGVAVLSVDIKRIIAYSTISQLGYMMSACAVSHYSAALFHLLTHAFFKSLLFLGAGVVILFMNHEQDMRKMGGLYKILPKTYIAMLLALLSMVGLPFFSGFYSKHMILEGVHASTLPAAFMAYYALLFSVFITALYSFKLFFLVFHGSARSPTKAGKEPLLMWGPLMILAIPSVIIGFIGITPLFKAGALGQNGFFTQSMVQDMGILPAGLQTPLVMGLEGFYRIEFLLGIAGFAMAGILYYSPKAPHHRVCQAKVCQAIDYFNYYGLKCQSFFIRAMNGLGFFCFYVLDQKILDGVMVGGVSKQIQRLAQGGRQIQSGYLYYYILSMIIGLICLLIYV